MWTVPTFLLVLLQGLFGSIPWVAIRNFATLWLQYEGLDNSVAAACMAAFNMSGGIGGLLGGLLGDAAAAWSADMGRPRVAQLAKCLSLLGAAVLFVYIPSAAPRMEVAHVHAAYISSFTFLGLTASWTRTGVNQPMLSEVVPPRMVSTVMATEVGIESACAALMGGPLAAYLAKHTFGYVPSTAAIRDTSEALRTQSAHALQLSLAWMTLVPWGLCFLCYLAVGCTFKVDRDRASSKAL